jgi:hypothetical protein
LDEVKLAVLALHPVVPQRAQIYLKDRSDFVEIFDFGVESVFQPLDGSLVQFVEILLERNDDQLLLHGLPRHFKVELPPPRFGQLLESGAFGVGLVELCLLETFHPIVATDTFQNLDDELSISDGLKLWVFELFDDGAYPSPIVLQISVS